MIMCCLIFELHHIPSLPRRSYSFLCYCLHNKRSHCIYSWSFASVCLCPLYTNVNSRSSVKNKEKRKKSETRTKKIYKKTSPTHHQQTTTNNNQQPTTIIIRTLLDRQRGWLLFFFEQFVSGIKLSRVTVCLL